MRLLRFIRRPFTWLVLAEVAVVAGLGAAAWHLVAAALAEPTASAASRLGGPYSGIGRAGPLSVPPGVVLPTPGALPVLPVPTPRRVGPTPSLSTSSGFLESELKAINRDQSTWERSEWTIIEAILRFARAYIDGVVLPGVRAAESRGP